MLSPPYHNLEGIYGWEEGQDNNCELCREDLIRDETSYIQFKLHRKSKTLYIVPLCEHCHIVVREWQKLLKNLPK